MPREAALMAGKHTDGRSGVSQCCRRRESRRAAVAGRQCSAQMLRYGGAGHFCTATSTDFPCTMRLGNGYSVVMMCRCVWTAVTQLCSAQASLPISRQAQQTCAECLGMLGAVDPARVQVDPHCRRHTQHKQPACPGCGTRPKALGRCTKSCAPSRAAVCLAWPPAPSIGDCLPKA